MKRRFALDNKDCRQLCQLCQLKLARLSLMPIVIRRAYSTRSPSAAIRGALLRPSRFLLPLEFAMADGGVDLEYSSNELRQRRVVIKNRDLGPSKL
jgi:hypothetical protein